MRKKLVSTSRFTRAETSTLEDTIIGVLRVGLAALRFHMRRLQVLGYVYMH